MIEFAIIISFGRKSLEGQTAPKKYKRSVLPLVNSNVLNEKSLKLRQMNRIRQKLDVGEKFQKKTTDADENVKYLQKIDLNCFWGFLLGYVLFNMIYWAQMMSL